jgi:hypothetical protein
LIIGMSSLFILALYIRTAYPTVAGGDNGELLSIACTGGVAHPPGYPLWVMLSMAALALGAKIPGLR